MKDKRPTTEESFEMYLHLEDWVQKNLTQPKQKTQVNINSINSVKIKRK